jgi:hypothetical protein
MLLNLSAAVVGGYLLSFATKRAHIAYRKVKLRNLLGRQYLLPSFNPRHLVMLFLQNHSIRDRLMKKPPRVRIGRGRRLHLDRVEAPGVGVHRAATKSELPTHRARDWVWA